LDLEARAVLNFIQSFLKSLQSKQDITGKKIKNSTHDTRSFGCLQNGYFRMMLIILLGVSFGSVVSCRKAYGVRCGKAVV
jgi:hypothetical protein